MEVMQLVPREQIQEHILENRGCDSVGATKASSRVHRGRKVSTFQFHT